MQERGSKSPPFFNSTKGNAVKKTDRRELLTFIGFIAPGLLLYLFIIAYPICYSVFLSFTNYNPTMTESSSFVGFANYIKVLTMNKGIVDATTEIPEFWYAFKNNMIVVAVSVFGQLADRSRRCRCCYRLLYIVIS